MVVENHKGVSKNFLKSSHLVIHVGLSNIKVNMLNVTYFVYCVLSIGKTWLLKMFKRMAAVLYFV